MPQPKSLKRKLEAIKKYVTNDDSYSATVRKTRAREFEEHSQKYLERKYGKKSVNNQRYTESTGKRPDHTVDTDE